MSVWISHRGLHKKHAENTLGAFEAAVANGFTELETDLRLSQDGHLVLCHDPTLDRIAGDPGEVRAKTRKELQELRLTSGEGLLFFDEFAARFQAQVWTLDIKPEHGAETLHALFAWAKERDLTKKLAASRFLMWVPEHEEVLRSYLPEAKVYARRDECWRAGLCVLLGVPWLGKIKANRIYSLVPRVSGLSAYRAAVAKSYQSRKAQVLAFLPEDPKDAQDAAKAGFDYILTNHERPPT